MNLSEENFKELDEGLKIKDDAFKQLKHSILTQASQKKRSKKPFVLVLATACMLLFVTSPLYSPVMAKLAAKIVPIEIYPSFTSNREDEGLLTKLVEYLTAQGYDVNSIGVLTSNVIEISLISEQLSLKQVEEQLGANVDAFLADNGYDLYDVQFSIVDLAEQENVRSKNLDLYDQARQIVKDVFAAYGYAIEADYELAGMRETWFSNILLIDMPDHIKESKEIVANIQAEIDKQALDIKDIEVTSFNFKHRLQDNRWAYLASDIFDAMAGKSTYQLSELSYSVKKGHTHVYIKTNWSEKPPQTVINEITEAVETYLELPETKSQRRDDLYTIQFLNIDGEAFINISNKQ